MKENYGWWYLKGFKLHDLVTWIYLRPDIFVDRKKRILLTDDIFKYGILNQHYFLVKVKAIFKQKK